MNASVGEDAPVWMCPESRNFQPWHESDYELEEEVENKVLFKYDIPQGYFIAKEHCEDFGMSYKMFCRARERGRIHSIKLPCGICTREEDILTYLDSRSRGGRPKK